MKPEHWILTMLFVLVLKKKKEKDILPKSFQSESTEAMSFNIILIL
jgi:hypothetical protein